MRPWDRRAHRHSRRKESPDRELGTKPERQQGVGLGKKHKTLGKEETAGSREGCRHRPRGDGRARQPYIWKRFEIGL